MKLALNLIVKPSNDEAKVLKRCLTSIAPYVDGIFLTITGENKACEEVGKLFDAHITTCEWENDFAKARNFALAQIPKDYDYWMWLDCDDVIDGAENLRSSIEDHPHVDAFILNYLYHFDKWGNPVVVHTKTRIVRHDDCVEWRGKLHEDFHQRRKLDASFVKDINILHLTSEKRIEDSKKRNVKVAKFDLETNPDDPRSFWNVANSLKAAGKDKRALTMFRKFLKLSESDDEKYIVHMRMSEIFWGLKDLQKALDHARMAVAINPATPDAHILSARILFASGRYLDAKESCMFGLKLEPRYLKTIVYNPRDYDYEPLKLLAQIYLALSVPQLALEMLKSCYEITPKDEDLAQLIDRMTIESDKSTKAMELVAELQKIEDLDELRERISEVDPEIASHPALCHLRNTKLVKTESSGKDLVFYCGNTKDEWNPQIAKESGIGGSEEAVIHLSKRFAAAGWNVTVFNNCGHKAVEFDGVTFRPYWEWNYRDKQDVLILWRQPKALDYGLNADKVFLDMHDVIPPEELSEKRLEGLTKIFVKSDAQRELFPDVPDDKFAVVPNGIVWEQMQDDSIERDPNLLINTSSPDRSIRTLIDAFKRVKAEVPEAKLKWAYGWNVWDVVHGANSEMMDWKNKVEEEIAEIDGFETLGRIGHDAVARLYQEANVFAYPTAFFEIDCISARKAQAAGAVPVSTDFAALNTTIQHGVKIKTDMKKENWIKPGAFDFSLKEKKAVDEWVEAAIEQLKNPMSEEKRAEMREDMKRFDWDSISTAWLDTM
jgi:glycosyltransferase involved in cell wall biosynthesis